MAEWRLLGETTMPIAPTDLQTARTLLERIQELLPLVRHRQVLELLCQYLIGAGAAPSAEVQEAARQVHVASWELARRCAEVTGGGALAALREGQLPKQPSIESAEALQAQLAELKALHDSIGAVWMIGDAVVDRWIDLKKRLDTASVGESGRSPSVAGGASLSNGSGLSAGLPSGPTAEVGSTERRWRKVPDLSIELGLDLVPLVDPSRSPGLVETVRGLRSSVLDEWGVRVGPVQIIDHHRIASDAYRILLHGEVLATGTLHLGRSLALCPVGEISASLRGQRCVDPAFGMSACWIEQEQVSEAAAFGYTTVSPMIVLRTHLAELFRQNLAELFGLAQFGEILEGLEAEVPQLVRALDESGPSRSTVVSVFRRLLDEGIPVRNASMLIETCIARASSDPEHMVEACRARLARTLSRVFRGTDETLRVLHLAPELEAAMLPAPFVWHHATPALDADGCTAVLAALEQGLGAWAHADRQEPVLIVSQPELRSLLARFLQRRGWTLPVLSVAELPAGATVERVGPPISLSAAG